MERNGWKEHFLLRFYAVLNIQDGVAVFLENCAFKSSKKSSKLLALRLEKQVELTCGATWSMDETVTEASWADPGTASVNAACPVAPPGNMSIPQFDLFICEDTHLSKISKWLFMGNEKSNEYVRGKVSHGK